MNDLLTSMNTRSSELTQWLSSSYNDQLCAQDWYVFICPLITRLHLKLAHAYSHRLLLVSSILTTSASSPHRSPISLYDCAKSFHSLHP